VKSLQGGGCFSGHAWADEKMISQAHFVYQIQLRGNKTSQTTWYEMDGSERDGRGRRRGGANEC
jgi:hypothetical protein